MTPTDTSMAKLIETLEAGHRTPNVNRVYEGARLRARRRRTVRGGIVASGLVLASVALVSQIDDGETAVVVFGADDGTTAPQTLDAPAVSTESVPLATQPSPTSELPIDESFGQGSLLDRVVGVSTESAGALLGEAGFVLVDDSGATIPSGNDRNGIFGFEISAYRQSDGSTGYFTTFNNYPDERLLSWQCGTDSRGSLVEVNDQADLVFRSGEYPQTDEDFGFGAVELVDCGELLPVDFARLFDTEFTLVADGNDLLFSTGGDTVRFRQVDEVDRNSIPDTISPATTVPQ